MSPSAPAGRGQTLASARRPADARRARRRRRRCRAGEAQRAAGAAGAAGEGGGAGEEGRREGRQEGEGRRAGCPGGAPPPPPCWVGYDGGVFGVGHGGSGVARAAEEASGSLSEWAPAFFF